MASSMCVAHAYRLKSAVNETSATSANSPGNRPFTPHLDDKARLWFVARTRSKAAVSSKAVAKPVTQLVSRTDFSKLEYRQRVPLVSLVNFANWPTFSYYTTVKKIATTLADTRSACVSVSVPVPVPVYLYVSMSV